MAHDFLIFDFGNNEEVAQQARHKVEGWTQGFRLGKKMLLKFEREAADDSSESESGADPKKLSHQRWLDRIPTEEPFKSAKAEIIRQGQPGFAEAAELFDSLS